MAKTCKKFSKTSIIYGGMDYSREQKFQRHFEGIVSGTKIENQTACEQALQRTAFVKFKMSTQDVVKIRRDLRVSLAYLLSGFGKST